MISKKSIIRLEELLARMPVRWDGRKAILEMRDSGYPHWKQMEWIGLYFQFLFKRALEMLMEVRETRKRF